MYCFWKKLYSFLLLGVILMMSSPCVYAETSQYSDGSRKYIGTINQNINIHLALEKQGTEISGWYYYDSQRIKLVLRGSTDGNSFNLKEYDEYGDNTGIFKGTFTAGGRIEGYWLSSDGCTQLPFQANVLPIAGPGQVARLDYSSQPITFEVSFSPGHSYIVSVEGRSKTTYGFPLKVYQDEKVVFEKTLVGDGGEIDLVDARGGGRMDLVAILAGGNGGYLNDFCVIGETVNGVGLLATKELLKMGYTWPKVSAFTNKIGIEFNPAGAWTRYRVDVSWQPETETYVRSNPVRITPQFQIPAADKTVLFSLKPEDRKIKYFDGDNIVTEVHIRAGDKLLLRRDPTMSQELGLSYWENYDKAVIRSERVGENFLLTAINQGTTKISLFQPHNASTQQELLIIVDP